MDIHPPHGAIHTKKDFFIHLLTIIAGILIALGLEALITWSHHRVLVREARANLVTEIQRNRQTLEDGLPEIRGRKQNLDTMIQAVRDVEAGKPKPHIEYNNKGYDLSSAAWKTASSSGATAYMDYNELKDYTDIYDLQELFMNWQNETFKAMADMSDLPPVMDLDAKTVPRERFERIVTAASRTKTTDDFLLNIAEALDKQYAAIGPH